LPRVDRVGAACSENSGKMSASALSPTLDRRHNQRCLLAGHVVVDLQWADHHVIRHGVEKQIKTTDVAPIFFACPRWPADRIMTHFRLTGRTAPRHSAMANITECSNVSKSTKVKRLRNRRREGRATFSRGRCAPTQISSSRTRSDELFAGSGRIVHVCPHD